MENAASLATGPDGRKRRVSYFFEPEIGQPKEPYASHLAHSLIFKHGLHRDMEIINRPILAGVSDFLRFHSRDYIDFLASITPMTLNDPSVFVNVSRSRFFYHVYMDRNAPLFHGLFDYCRAYAGCSLTAAAKLNRRETDIAINWSGGMHRAKSDKASEFCFVNDIVLGILELLKAFKRVLYIDIGYRRGDGVEEAFYDTDRVMTVSFHTDDMDTWTLLPRYGDGRELYALNAPLKDWLKDKSLRNLFRPVITKAVEVYQPEVIVLQCGGDSLAEGWPSRFNLKIKGHADCLQFVRSFNVPLMVLGGGGSEPAFVSRCWCYETAIAVGVEEQLENDLKVNEFLYKPNFNQDLNTPRDIELIRNGLLRQLSQLIHAPSVQFQDTPSMSQAIEPAEVDMEKRQVISNLRRSKL